MLIDHSAQIMLDFFHAWGRCFKGSILLRRGEEVEGLEILRAALFESSESRFFRYLAFLCDLAQSLGRVREYRQGRTEIESALARSTRNEELWCIAELLGIKGELILAKPRPTPRRWPRSNSSNRSTELAARARSPGTFGQPCPPVAGARGARCGAGHACTDLWPVYRRALDR
jgi:hypothetical protein